ncbi:hypothetical protein [Pseudactinotalea terrae]|uniref:hypothetical protein n=1 Tax=Pseudactinotalea terrae TaxID=1743262 RepID=UPI0012E190C8|nr:hypothetical protein [Pseudactinotalea terrae]
MTETEDPRWRAAAAAKASEGAALMRQFGAHGLGVAWVDTGAGQEPGLMLVVAAAPAAVPEPVLVEVDGHRYAVPVSVELAPPAQSEEARPG